MQNNKSPGNDEQTKEFFVVFWKDIKYSLKKTHVVQQNLKRN